MTLDEAIAAKVTMNAQVRERVEFKRALNTAFEAKDLKQVFKVFFLNSEARTELMVAIYEVILEQMTPEQQKEIMQAAILHGKEEGAKLLLKFLFP